MHDDREAASERDAGFLETSTLGDIHSPCLQGEGLPASGEDRVGCFVEQLAHRAIALLGDPPGPVDLAGLMAPGHETEVGASIA